MIESLASTTPTERVVARLASEGWVNCPNLGFPALCQQSPLKLREFVLKRLQQAGNRMWEADLQLSVLIFSIPAHEFQIHPHLKAMLQQLEAERVIEIYEQENPTLERRKTAREILLKAINVP
jgi:hypothetical protein